MKKATIPYQFTILTFSILLIAFFDQKHCVLIPSGTGSKKLETFSSFGNQQDFVHQENNMIEVESLVVEFGKVVEKISRVKRYWTPEPEQEEKCTPEKVIERNNCVKDLLHQVNFGIPSNRHETETACRSFSIAMKCMGKWAAICLNETAANSYNSYVAPAAETYSYICKDKQSRAKFYRNGACFRKITPGFDACVDEMGAKLNSLREDKHALQICCHQRNFLKCVSQVLIENQCSAASSQAMMETAERTVQFRPDQLLKKNNTKGVCIRMTNGQCAELLIAEKRKKKSSSDSNNEVSSLILPIIGISFAFVLY